MNVLNDIFQVCPEADNCASTAKCNANTGGVERRRREVPFVISPVSMIDVTHSKNRFQSR